MIQFKVSPGLGQNVVRLEEDFISKNGEFEYIKSEISNMSPEDQRRFLSDLGINLSDNMEISLNKKSSVLKPIKKRKINND